MKFEHKRKKDIINFFNGKGFYLVAGLSLVAIGAAAWTAVASLREINLNQDFTENSSSIVSEQTESSQQITSEKVDTAQKDTSSKKENVSSKAPTQEAQSANAVAEFFIMPISGGEILKPYSDTELQFSHTYSDFRIHRALDIKAERDTAVYACGKGTVTELKEDALLGSVIKIDHGNGVVVCYCGVIPNKNATVGSVVDSSVVIGSVSTIPSESVEQAHLHLEFYKDGKYVSPQSFITN